MKYGTHEQQASSAAWLAAARLVQNAEQALATARALVATRNTIQNDSSCFHEQLAGLLSKGQDSSASKILGQMPSESYRCGIGSASTCATKVKQQSLQAEETIAHMFVGGDLPSLADGLRLECLGARALAVSDSTLSTLPAGTAPLGGFRSETGDWHNNVVEVVDEVHERFLPPQRPPRVAVETPQEPSSVESAAQVGAVEDRVCHVSSLITGLQGVLPVAASPACAHTVVKCNLKPDCTPVTDAAGGYCEVPERLDAAATLSVLPHPHNATLLRPSPSPASRPPPPPPPPPPFPSKAWKQWHTVVPSCPANQLSSAPDSLSVATAGDAGDNGVVPAMQTRSHPSPLLPAPPPSPSKVSAAICVGGGAIAGEGIVPQPSHASSKQLKEGSQQGVYEPQPNGSPLQQSLHVKCSSPDGATPQAGQSFGSPVEGVAKCPPRPPPRPPPPPPPVNGPPVKIRAPPPPPGPPPSRMLKKACSEIVPSPGFARSPVPPPPGPITRAPTGSIATPPGLRRRQIHWQPLRSVEDTVWTAPGMGPSVDLTLVLDALFTEQEPKIQRSSRAIPQRSADSSKSLPDKRTSQVEIALKRIKLEPDVLAEALRRTDASMFQDEDDLAALAPCIPNEEELHLVRSRRMNSSIGQPSKVEHLYLRLGQVPRVHAKLRIMQFKASCVRINENVREHVELYRCIVDQLMHSHRLQCLLQTVVQLGNAMNVGKTPAQGVKLSVVDLLPSVKAFNKPDVSFMHYLVAHIRFHHEAVLAVAEDVPSLAHPPRISFEELNNMIDCMRAELQCCVAELHVAEEEGDDVCVAGLQDFVSHMSQNLTHLFWELYCCKWRFRWCAEFFSTDLKKGWEASEPCALVRTISRFLKGLEDVEATPGGRRKVDEILYLLHQAKFGLDEFPNGGQLSLLQKASQKLASNMGPSRIANSGLRGSSKALALHKHYSWLRRNL